MFATEIKEHLVNDLIPFWQGLKDEENGGFYGYLSYDLKLDKKAVKGCILNSRILWFFSNAYMVLGDPSLLESAAYAYQFLKEHCVDDEFGGVFWSLTYDGKPEDTTKHTYNQAFSIYALASYYDASKTRKHWKLPGSYMTWLSQNVKMNMDILKHSQEALSRKRMTNYQKMV